MRNWVELRLVSVSCRPLHVTRSVRECWVFTGDKMLHCRRRLPPSTWPSIARYNTTLRSLRNVPTRPNRQRPGWGPRHAARLRPLKRSVIWSRDYCTFFILLWVSLTKPIHKSVLVPTARLAKSFYEDSWVSHCNLCKMFELEWDRSCSVLPMEHPC